MHRQNIIRQSLLFLAVGTWVFLMLALASFHSDDWPSHQVYPYPPAPQNLCGSVGAVIAYYGFLALGQGVFPILFFSGVCLALVMFKNQVGDLWLRAVGLLLLTIAFSAVVHNIKPGSSSAFPEGHGGIVGIGASTYLQSHFSTVGTRLILLTGILIGLLLVADDLVLRTPVIVGHAIVHVKQRAPAVRWKFPPLPKLPPLPNFMTRDAVKPRPAVASRADDDDDSPLKPPVILKREKPAKPAPPLAHPLDPETIDLKYDHDDEPLAAADEAFSDEQDPGPSELATIPPPDQQSVAKPEATINKNIIVRLPSMIKPRQTSPPPPPPKELGEYHLPDWDLLDDAEHGFAESQEQFVREKAVVLERALKEFDIEAHVVEIDTGPVITMYELTLAPGIKVSQITALSNDIARALAATNVRIVAPVPGKHTVGIEVPNAQKEKVRLKELMQLAPEASTKMTIPLFLGKDASGEPLVTDLAAMPHCLIAGTTGSGKSVCINSILMSIMYKQRPDMVKLILVDPKVVEMAPFKDIPHLMCPVINETGRATSVLDWACEKMDERYEVLAEAGVRNIAG
jgi:S-DNA-T family DNA segregation ATPase FtsK/SpoIIIE